MKLKWNVWWVLFIAWFILGITHILIEISELDYVISMFFNLLFLFIFATKGDEWGIND